MKTKSATRLRIYLDETDTYQGLSLSEYVVQQAKKQGLAGAFVIRGIMGFGHDKQVHTTSLLSLSDQLPIVIEIIDDRNRIEAFYPLIKKIVQENLITLEQIEILS